MKYTRVILEYQTLIKLCIHSIEALSDRVINDSTVKITLNDASSFFFSFDDYLTEKHYSILFDNELNIISGLN